MSLSIIRSRAACGIEAAPVSVEVHLSNGLPRFNIVGMPETAVKESKDRVRSAILTANLKFPDRRITVNLAPADLPKEGGRFDLPIAVGILAASRQLRSQSLGVLAAVYPAVWGLGQLVTGGLSDRIGRKPLIAGGMLTQAVAIGAIATTSGFWAWAAGAAMLGAGTAMVYPTLLAAIGDVAYPRWRARSVGVYRLWRDGGFAVGALLAGLIADAVSIEAAIWAVAALTALSGLIVIVRMYETHAPDDRRLAN